MAEPHTNPTAAPRKRALVTGASTGIGAAFAQQLAGLGYDLILVARTKSLLDELARKLHDRHGSEVTVVAADLSTKEGQSTVVRLVASDPGLSMLVNAAGSANWGNHADLEVAGEVALIELNVVALVRLTKAALPAMLARGQGAIINVASLSSFAPIPSIATYCGTKSFVANFTESLYEELRGTGVYVQALCPGFTRTNIFARAGANERRVPKILWQTPEAVVRCSLKALRRRQARCVPGLRNYVCMLWVLWMPRWMSRHIASNLLGRFEKLDPRPPERAAPVTT
ncbi:MAG TPA: SDR family oxidoreductase [Pirellulales bacterium]|jgi:hypothetical protein|nr:SDR family oxidoreductase [Pirellulales bacterium]